ncbi:MAG: efflux RND transporter periplasmic adaptor subunit, partial [Saprospiraceae bacterium]|nr:efflux RND transporter periplasmic adaptor subunit [Saprospiraceae bacterium]
MRTILFSLLMIGVFFACNGKKNPSIANHSELEERIPVHVVQVQRQTGSLPVVASGMVTSDSEQRLSFKIGGIIKRIYVEEGDQIRPGQLLAALDKTEIDAQVKQATEALTKAERDLGRVEGLYRDSSATLELLQNATTARDVAKETLKIAQFNQAFAEIRATRSGKIIKKIANEGEITGPGMPALVLFETGPKNWVVKIAVSDRDWARLETGMPAKIKLDAYENEMFSGKVKDLAPAADPSNGLYPVELSLDTKNKRLAPGLFASVEITPSKSRNYTSIPLEALVEGSGLGAYVFVPQPDSVSVKKLPVLVA